MKLNSILVTAGLLMWAAFWYAAFEFELFETFQTDQPEAHCSEVG